MTVEPVMRTQAQQQQINQVRLEAETYQMKLLAGIDQRNQDFANFVGAKMTEMNQRHPHVTYNVFAQGGQPPPPPPPSPMQADPNQQQAAFERRLEQERRESQLRLHEAAASAKRTVHQEMLALQGEVKRAEEVARGSSSCKHRRDPC